MTLAAAPMSLPDVSASRANMASVRERLRGLLSNESRESVERMILRLRGDDAPFWLCDVQSSPLCECKPEAAWPTWFWRESSGP